MPCEIAEAIVNPSAYADWNRIDPAYAWLRRNVPVARVAPDGYDCFRALIRHADIPDVERHSDVFPSGRRTITLAAFLPGSLRALDPR